MLKYALKPAALACLAAFWTTGAGAGMWDAWMCKDHEAEAKCKSGEYGYDPVCSICWGIGGNGGSQRAGGNGGNGGRSNGGAYGGTSGYGSGSYAGSGGGAYGAAYSKGSGAGAGYGSGYAKGAGTGAGGAFYGAGCPGRDPIGVDECGTPGPNKPIVLCRQKGCTQLNDKMTDSYLFNSIANLLYINDKTKVYICEADTNTRACTATGLKYAVNVGGTAGVIHIPSMTITEVTFSQNLKRINFMLSYDLYANGVKSFCTSAHSTIEISANKQALIRDNNYNCQLTSDLPSTSYNIYNIDYVDLDYGIIGAYYSIGMSGASSGGASGYALLKFQYTDANSASAAKDCGGSCKSENYKIAPGQYEAVPLK